MGRPATLNREEIIDHILAQIAEGRSVARILEEDQGLCSYAQWSRWQVESLELRERTVRAREEGATKLLEEVIEIADAPKGDVYIAYEKGEPVAKIDGDTVQRAKLRVYARERYAALIAPKLYGNKLDVTSGGEKLPAPNANANDAKLNALLALAMARKQGARPAPMIDVTPEPVDPLADIFDE